MPFAFAGLLAIASALRLAAAMIAREPVQLRRSWWWLIAAALAAVAQA